MPFQRRWLLCLSLVLFAMPGISSALAVEEPEKQLYIAHFARFTAQIPADWQVDPTGTFDYIGEDGFVSDLPLSGATIDEACATLMAPEFGLTGATMRAATVAGQTGCRVDARYQGTDVAVIAVPHPFPFEVLDQRFEFAGLMAEPDDIDAIAATVNFATELVTPEAFLESVIDIVEARAYWSSEIDWEATRVALLEWLRVTPSMELASGIVADLISRIRAAGDSHSYVIRAGGPNVISDGEGVGFLLGQRRVLLVYDGSSADLAGIRAGDIIETVNGEPFHPPSGLHQAERNWPSPTTLTLRREGSEERFTVTIEHGPFKNYVAPTGRRVAEGIGYLEIPLFRIPDREVEFSTVANDLIASIDQPPTCGWVIDLRLNMGGSYSPMVTAAGPILGNGTFVGWQYSDGLTTWITYENGRIFDNERDVSNYLEGTMYELQQPNPPVAVLIGPLTSSSGEVTTLAFVDRPDARHFGETTAGLATAIQGQYLFDGTLIGLATSAMVDRTGATHLDGIEPDEHITIDWSTYGTDDDPVIDAALEWLNQQPACSKEATPVP